MSPEKQVQVGKQVKRLHAALKGEKYVLGYIRAVDGEDNKGLIHVNVKNEAELKDLALFLHNAAKQNQVFGALLDYVWAIQDNEKKAAAPKKKGWLILPKLKLIR